MDNTNIHSKRSQVLLASCIGSAVLALLSIFLVDEAQLTQVYQSFGFAFLFVSFLAWLGLMLPRGMQLQACLSFLKREGWVLVLVLVLPTLMFLVSPRQFRILEDETNLLGVANSMFSKHSFANMTDTLYHSGAQFEVRSQWGIRPNFFPFLIYLVHCLKGYSAYNGFLVNFAAAALCLWSLHWLLKQWFRRAVALFGVMTLAAFPVFVLWVTSSGFEIVNLCFVLVAFCLLHQYLATRESYRLERLVLTLALLAQVRYESSVFAIAFALVLLFSLRWKSMEKLSFRMLAAPWFFLPIGWQRVLKADKGSYQVFGDDEAFGLVNWKRHISTASDYFAGTEERYGTIGLVFWIALAGFLLGIIQVLGKRQRPSRETRHMLAAASTSLLALVIVIFAYFWGDLTVSFTIRLGIVFLPFLIFGSCYFAEQLFSSRWNRLSQSQGTQLCFSIGLALCLFHWPTAAKNEAALQLTLNQHYQTSLAFLEEEYPEHNNLIISDRPGMYSVHRWGAVTAKYANRNVKKFKQELRQQLYQNIIVIQVIDDKDGKALNGTQLNPKYRLERLHAAHYNGSSSLVISKILVE